jgi:glycerol-3-phosphate dehydrogenase (NAD(P)+)
VGSPLRVGVLGGGAWGGVLAWLAARRGHDVALWEIDAEAARALARDRSSARSVPGFRLPEPVQVSSDLGASVRDRDLLLLVVPSAFVRGTIEAASGALTGTPIVVCASKGLEPGTGETMAEVLARKVPAARIAVLSGPSFAQEIAGGLPAALVAAASDPEVAGAVRACLGSERLRIYTSDDVTGVSLGGALKNVIAIAVGCCDGFGLGDNARAALVTRGLAEMGRLAERMGGRALTLSGLAGLGDLVLTCTGELSRNRQVGLALARGEPLDRVLARLGHVAEGVGTARTARTLAERLAVDMPITGEVAAVLYDGKSPRDAVNDLLARDTRAEHS